MKLPHLFSRYVGLCFVSTLYNNLFLEATGLQYKTDDIIHFNKTVREDRKYISLWMNLVICNLLVDLN